MAARALYTLKAKGEKDSYALIRHPRSGELAYVRLSDPHSREDMAEALSDLTGYRAEYITKHVLRAMPIKKPREISQAGGWGPVTFILTRVQ